MLADRKQGEDERDRPSLQAVEGRRHIPVSYIPSTASSGGKGREDIVYSQCHRFPLEGASVGHVGKCLNGASYPPQCPASRLD